MRRSGLMRKVLVIGLLLSSLVWAQETAEPPQALTLEQAFGLALSTDADLLSARSELESAQRDLRRIQADPLALRLETLQAEQGVAAAQAALTATEVSTRTELASAYSTALEADESLTIAQKQEAIALQTLEAQKIRLDAGAVTQIDVDKANNDYQAALRDRADAEASRSLAYAQVSSLLGQTVTSLEPLGDDLLSLPNLDEVKTRAQSQNAQLLATSRNVELLKTRLAAIDNAFSSRSEIEAARDNLDNAQISYSESLRTLDLNIQNSYNSVLSAQARYESAVANYSTAQADLNAQKTRLDAGSISPLSFAQSELSFQTTVSSLNSARHAFYLSLLRLEQAVVGQ